MVDLLLYIYLVAPSLVGLAALLYALTRASDRIQLATLALFALAVLYSAQAYDLARRGDVATVIGVALGIYALAIYVCVVFLAVDLRRWAWRAALVICGLHVPFCFLAYQASPLPGWKSLLLVAGYLAVAAIGLWALLHKGTRLTVGAARPQ